MQDLPGHSLSEIGHMLLFWGRKREKKEKGHQPYRTTRLTAALLGAAFLGASLLSDYLKQLSEQDGI